MARRNIEEVEQVDTAAEETVEVKPDADTHENKAAQKKQPARGDLPEGYVTPVQLAKVLTEKGLHTDKNGEKVEVKPQMVYSYMKNAPKDDPFPIEKVTDSLGNERQAVLEEKGIAWWTRKNERVSTKRQNAADKATKKAEAAAKREAAKEAEAEADTTEADAAEAE